MRSCDVTMLLCTRMCPCLSIHSSQSQGFEYVSLSSPSSVLTYSTKLYVLSPHSLDDHLVLCVCVCVCVLPSFPSSSVLTTIATVLGVKGASLQRGLSKRTYISGRGTAVKTACSAAGVSSTAYTCLYMCVYVCVHRMWLP